ncbi:MAG: hypothetical protein R3C30_14700 [Hyphomonadaceae bacterium]
MRSFLKVTAAVCLIASTLAPGVAFAKADNAAVAEHGQGCLVADGDGNYTVDANCEYHVVTRNDASGATVLVSYQDHGTLPEGAPRPRAAVRRAVTSIVGGQTCEGNEITTPSGEYRSDCRFHAGH